MVPGRIFGQAGDRLILEERLDGQEASILALTDGRTIVPLESCQGLQGRALRPR